MNSSRSWIASAAVHNRPRVVHLVRQRHPQDRILADIGKVLQVAPLPLDPRLRRVTVDRVRAPLDDGCDRLPEAALDPLQHRPAATVLDRIVKHRANRLILVAAVLEHQTGHDEQVRQIRDLGSRTTLAAVYLRRHRDGRQESRGERRRRARRHVEPRLDLFPRDTSFIWSLANALGLSERRRTQTTRAFHDSHPLGLGVGANHGSVDRVGADGEAAGRI